MWDSELEFKSEEKIKLNGSKSNATLMDNERDVFLFIGFIRTDSKQCIK